MLWSLSIEEVFYLGFPLICLLFGRYWLLQTILFAALALSLPLLLHVIAHAPEIWREKAYLPGISAISMGVCTALLVSKMPGRDDSRLTMAAGYLATACLVVFFLWEDAVYRMLGDGSMPFLTGSLAVLLAAFHRGWGQSVAWKGTGWLRSFGVMSYEVYLTHMFVVFSVVGVFHLSGAGPRTGWVWFILVLGLTWCLGRLVDRLLSSPADRWIRMRLGTSTAMKIPAGV